MRDAGRGGDLAVRESEPAGAVDLALVVEFGITLALGGPAELLEDLGAKLRARLGLALLFCGCDRAEWRAGCDRRTGRVADREEQRNEKCR